MARAHKVFLNKLVLLIWRLNAEIDRGSSIPIEEIYVWMEKGNVVEMISVKFGAYLAGDTRLGIQTIDSEDDKTISESLNRMADSILPEEFGIKKNGLAYLIVLIGEMIGKEDWTSFP